MSMLALSPAVALCGGIALVAAAWDVATRRIPNFLTLGGIAIGLTIHATVGAVEHGFGGAARGAGVALLGLVLCAALPVVSFARGEMGGGDVKLFAAIGALCGPSLGFNAEAFAFATLLLVIWPWRFALSRFRGKALRARVIFGPSILVGLGLAILQQVVQS